MDLYEAIEKRRTIRVMTLYLPREHNGMSSCQPTILGRVS